MIFINLYKQLKNWRFMFLLVILSVFFLHGFGLYSSSGRDDVHITYWASKILVETGELTNLNGKQVEQSSSLLHVLLLSLLYAVSGIPLPTIGGMFSIFMGALTLLLAWKYADFVEIENQWYVPILLALSPYFVYWSFGGLESTLVAFIVLLTLHSVSIFLLKSSSLKNLIYVFVAISCYLSVRPESIFVILLFFIVIIFFAFVQKIERYSKLDINNKLLQLVGLSLLSFLIISTWRYINFEQIFPQPVYAKASGIHIQKIKEGLKYIIRSKLFSLLILSAFSISTIYRTISSKAKGGNIKLIVLLSFIVAYLSFVVVSGGDWMEGGRFLVPLMPLIIIIAIPSIARLKKTGVLILTILVVISVSETILFAKQKSTGMPFFDIPKVLHSLNNSKFNISYKEHSWFEYTNKVHLRDIPVISALDHIISRLLKERNETVSILSNQMGMVPYYIAEKYFKNVEFIDMRALVTKHFTECEVTSELPKGMSGLELNYEIFFNHADDISFKCGITRPMIIYDLPQPEDRLKLMANNGYKVVYLQQGRVMSPFGGSTVGAGQYIAIRKDLLSVAGKNKQLVKTWPTLDLRDAENTNIP